MPTAYRNYVDGEWIESRAGETFEVRNPADTGDIVGEFQASTSADTDAAVEAAVGAQTEWATTPGPERGNVLAETARILEEQRDELTETLAREEGKTLDEAGGEVQRAIDIFCYYAEKARDLGGTVKSPSGTDTELYTKREPLGTVALITPWNYPIAIPAWKLAPALAAGNTAVLKPASAAPTVARKLLGALDDAGLPDGVANYVTGSGSEVGGTLASHEDIDGVSFTGSTAVGTGVAQAAADDLTRVQCEMGGKNPTVVMPSADVAEAVDIVGAGAFGVTGQACTACSRAIVHEDVYDEFVAGIVDYAASIEIGPGLENPDMGPHVTQSELESTLEYVDIATEDGANLETGGRQPEGRAYEDGHYVEPAVVSGVTSDMRIAQEEVFGPVLAVLKVDSFEAGVDVANDVEYGLSASIVTQDLSEAHRFTEEIESGVAKVNEKTTGLELHVPFGGYKQSSTDTYREQGDAGLDFFTSTKTVYMNY
ncbi:2,5-dioxovalerate dehydrogenase [Natrialba asiatica]|uniref:Aldehyde Dehydrogenase n=1 Tax=Natrialba asiatica (strain ATCC 700177 / DSM 12278 / JCM 9576 / FERM P-10747 / NBRC 102637 / 172P1) TaxID=29540 RepID=M0B594_NATA1|nr:aldehyde dehydrogenase family protein [Natrialba asiatica]ELZ05433.1 Aldehyde Dehydrogenase [Natrialba asiatica DSM 12278]